MATNAANAAVRIAQHPYGAAPAMRIIRHPFAPAASTRSPFRLQRPHQIVCVGRNYAAHIDELGNTRPTEPFHFLKPPSSILQPGAGPILAPRGCDLHYEVELAAIIARTGADDDRTPENALDAVRGWAVAIDMTARNYQEAAKEKRLPWALSKGFKTFTVVSHFIARQKILDPQNAELWLKVNGEEKQRDSTGLMLWSVAELLAHVASIAPLENNDLLLTGTPKGVGPVVPGDVITAGIRVNGEEIEEGGIEVKVEERQTGYGSKV